MKEYVMCKKYISLPKKLLIKENQDEQANAQKQKE